MKAMGLAFALLAGLVLDVHGKDISLPLTEAEQVDLRLVCVAAVRSNALSPAETEDTVARCGRLKAKIDAALAALAEKAKVPDGK